MRERVCKNCGGRAYKVVGQNMVKCMFCGTLYVDEQSSKEEEVLVVKAKELLREFKFEQAVSEFDKILSLYPMSFESYFGRALAKNKIVLYANKRGVKKRPRFFGEIKSIKDDEDYLKALEYAPPEVDKTYKEIAKRIDKILNGYNQIENETDVFVLTAKTDEKNEKINQMVDGLKRQLHNVFLFSGQNEEEVFKALKTAKVFLFVVNSDKNFTNGDFKNVYDRYLYFISEKQKAKTSYILILDKFELEDLPKEIILNKRNVYDMSSISFLEDIIHKVEKEKNVTFNEAAKLEKIEVEQVEPERVDYVDIATVEPTELGTYHVENIELSEANKIKWIFLLIKHGDFLSAQDLVSAELAKDPNNSQLLFAQLMIDRQINTEEEFFSNISNFNDKQLIDKILEYASKDFAEDFVNKWEDLLVSLDSEDYYETYLLYLAKYNTSNREKLVAAAERKAIDTMSEDLIQKVIKCLDKTDVQRFVNFYFALAQKSDKHDFYEKVLSLDQGHEQSNLMLLFQRFKTIEDKLTYQNREEIEGVLKYLGEDARNHFVGSIIEMILPIAFYDIEKACNQFDFYLSYVANEEKLVAQLQKVALELLNMGFFKEAEKYLAIAVSKSNEAELFWQLIKAKSHCKTDQELILTNVKLTKFPEWESLLSLSDEKQAERYAEIVSKINLYKGERQPFKPDLLDKVNLSIKLEEFINRNNKILLELEKEGYSGGVHYYKMQLAPFEKYLNKISEIETFEEYSDFVDKIKTRLSALELSLDSSVNVTHLQARSEVKNVIAKTADDPEYKNRKVLKDIKRDVFLRRFCFIFLELCPMLFFAGLLCFLIANPKEVWTYFNQAFFVVALILSIALAFTNIIIYVCKKKSATKSQLFAYLTVVILGLVNLVLFCVGFYFAKPIEINNADELQTLLKNAPHAEYEITCDIDMGELEWKAVNFSGTLDGNGFTLQNVSFESSGLFANNSGDLSDLKIQLKTKAYNAQKFGVIAQRNTGNIKNCQIFGQLTFNVDENALIGGIVAQNDGGIIEGSLAELTITMESGANEIVFGGIAGKSTDDTTIKKNVSIISLVLNQNTGKSVVGGLVGTLENSEDAEFSKNQAEIDFVFTGNGDLLISGGLVGLGYQASANNFSTGEVDATGFSGVGYVGGLYGQYENTHLSEMINHSYSTVEISGEITKGALVGNLGGIIDSCFTTSELQFVGNKMFTQAKTSNCCQNYSQDLEFNEDVWDLTSELPKLK